MTAAIGSGRRSALAIHEALAPGSPMGCGGRRGDGPGELAGPEVVRLHAFPPRRTRRVAMLPRRRVARASPRCARDSSSLVPRRGAGRGRALLLVR